MKQLPKLPFRCIFIILSLALTGCGLSGGSGRGTFPTDDSTTSTKQIVSVAVEANTAMIASWQDDIYNWLAPQPAYALNGLNRIASLPATSISVQALDADFQRQVSAGVPAYTVNFNAAKSTYDIEFDSVFTARLNLVVEARFNNGDVLYAPLFAPASENESVVINVGSHYALQELFATIDTSDELESMLPCETAVGCVNQPEVKAQLVKNLSLLAQGLDVTIPATSSVSEALSVLDSNLEFKTQIDRAAAAITRDTSPISGGTLATFDITDGESLSLAAVSTTYNSVWYGLSLDQIDPSNSSSQGVKLSNSFSTTAQANTSGEVTPNILETVTTLDLKRITLLEDIPFSRVALTQNNGLFSLDSSEPVNALTPVTTDTFQSVIGNVLHQRVFEQTIPDSSTSPTTGWVFNPQFGQLYKARTLDGEPNVLVAANTNTGASYQLTKNQAENFVRGTQQEAINTFSWEFHTPQTTSSFTTTDTSASPIHGRHYGVISFSTKLRDSGNIWETFAELSDWEATTAGTDTVMHPTQPTLNLIGSNPFYQTYCISRDDSQNFSSTCSSGFSSTDHDYGAQGSLISTQSNPGLNRENRGLVIIDGNSLGSATSDGDNLAFALNDATRGQGIVIATVSRTTTPTFTSAQTYQLQGNSLRADSANNLNILRSLNGSTLTFDATTGNPILSLNILELQHDIANNQLGSYSQPSLTNSALQNIQGSLSASKGSVAFKFDNVEETGRDLILQGFISEAADSAASSDTPGNLMTLIVRHGNDTLGLIFATLQQSLPTDP